MIFTVYHDDDRDDFHDEFEGFTMVFTVIFFGFYCLSGVGTVIWLFSQ
jgi:hypothetical protein